MAKNRIKGITIEIGGDVTGLDKALKDVNSRIKDTQTQLREVEKGLKFNPGNTELLAQKQRLLADAVKETGAKLQTLKEAEKQAQEQFAKGEITREQYEALQREIIKTENQLKSLEKQAAQSNATLAKIGAVASSVSEGANKVASATRGISTAAAGAIAGIAGLAYSAAAGADDLNTLSKQTGISTDMLQKAKYAADLIDVSYETFTGSINKMVGKLRTNEEGFAALGIATRNASGEMLSTEQIFFNAAEALSKIENETERDIAAQELFGKSAAELAGILDDGGAALQRLGNDAEKMGIILDGETLQSLNEVNDEIDTLKAKAKGEIGKAAAQALTALTPVLDDIAAAITRVLEKIGQMDSEQIKTIVNVLAVVAAISPVAGIIGKIAGAVAALTPIISAAGGALSTVFATIAMNPMILVITGIVAAVAAGVIAIVKHWDEIKAGFQKLKDKIAEIALKIAEVFIKLRDKINDFKERVKEKFTEVVDFIKSLPQRALQWGKDLIQNFIDGIKAKFQALKERLQGIAQTVKDFIGFSEPKLGPLSNFHTYAPDMMKLFAKGIKDNEDLIAAQMARSFEFAPLQLSSTVNAPAMQSAPAAAPVSAGKVVNLTINAPSIDESTVNYLIMRVNNELGAMA